MTPCSSSSRSAKVALGISSGSLIQRYIVARGTSGAAAAGDAPGMPAFAGRLSRDEISAVLAHVKSRWPAGVRAYQAALNRDGGEALAALLRDPAWTFPGECLTAPSEAVER